MPVAWLGMCGIVGLRGEIWLLLILSERRRCFSVRQTRWPTGARTVLESGSPRHRRPGSVIGVSP